LDGTSAFTDETKTYGEHDSYLQQPLVSTALASANTEQPSPRWWWGVTTWLHPARPKGSSCWVHRPLPRVV